jgi:hypothetical protein
LLRPPVQATSHYPPTLTVKAEVPDRQPWAITGL